MPHINISRSEKGNNIGSCRDLAMYLEKENEHKSALEKERWFNQTRSDISVFETIRDIDNNRKGLKADDAKFYLVNISPSQKEIEVLGNNEAEIKHNLKEYAREAMCEYARNFKLKTGKQIEEKDLVWYGKIEEHRYYKGEEEKVKDGSVKIGDKKPGENYHAQIIISHRDREMKTSLSPLTNDKERFAILEYKERCEQAFDKMTNYNRSKAEHFKYQFAFKNAGIQEKANLISKDKKQPEQDIFIQNIRQVRRTDFAERKANTPIAEKKKHYYDLQLGLKTAPKPQEHRNGQRITVFDFAPYKVKTANDKEIKKFNNISNALKYAEKQKDALVYNALKSNKVVATVLDGKTMVHDKDPSVFRKKMRFHGR